MDQSIENRDACAEYLFIVVSDVNFKTVFPSQRRNINLNLN